ncbi:hypothetical protein PO124_14640 [Bacillus licheniformis]|nr:hypothetical protein [Bacillus licheniformis]
MKNFRRFMGQVRRPFLSGAWHRSRNKSIVLAPGYPSASKGFGPPALFGQRMLVSAEELELYHGLNGFPGVDGQWGGNGSVPA